MSIKSSTAPASSDESLTLLWETEIFPQQNGQPPFYRIPVLICSRQGTLLAFCEARMKQTGDHAENNILLRRSFDGGKTWDPIQTVAGDGQNSLNNPTVVEVSETGRIILTYVRFPCGFHAVALPEHGIGAVSPGYKGGDIARSFVQTSDDDGLTWSEPREITRFAKRSADVRAVLPGPGIGIQLQRGRHKGRIVIPAYEVHRPDKVLALYSDDHGMTWTCGEPAVDAEEGTGNNENQMVELADGSIMVNSRHSGSDRFRRIARSQDGGASWSLMSKDPDLIDPGCQGSILRYRNPTNDDPGCLIFSNPASTHQRENGTIRLSYDDGRTWPVAKTFRDSGFFCYSCLATLPNNTIGCLYEGTPSNDVPITITFACLSAVPDHQ